MGAQKGELFRQRAPEADDAADHGAVPNPNSMENPKGLLGGPILGVKGEGVKGEGVNPKGEGGPILARQVVHLFGGSGERCCWWRLIVLDGKQWVS